MTWFAASIIISIRRTDMPKGSVLAYENVVLVEAQSADEAFLKAKEYGDIEVSIDDDFTVDGSPATKSFAGIRKLINISNPYPLNLDEDPPATGTEITYSLFELESDESLEKLVKGGEVMLRYIE